MNQQYRLIRSTVSGWAAVSGETGHAPSFRPLQSCPQHDWLPLSANRATGVTELWGAEGPVLSWMYFQALSGFNTCFSRRIDVVQQCWVTAQVSLLHANPPQPCGRRLKGRGLGFWSALCLAMARASPACRLRLSVPNHKWRWTFHLAMFPRHFQEKKHSKTWCGRDHRVITELLMLYWVYRYLCPSSSPTVCFSCLKAARHFLCLLLRADVPNSNHILLKNVRVVRGRMVNAFQSPLLFPPLNCRSRETTVVNRDLQNIQIYYRSKTSLCSFSCLLPLLKTALVTLQLQPGTGAELLPMLTAMETVETLTWFTVSSNSETSLFWEGVTRHTLLRCVP